MRELDALKLAISAKLTKAKIVSSTYEPMGEAITINIIADGGAGSLALVEEQVIAGIEEVREKGLLSSNIHINAKTRYTP